MQCCGSQLQLYCSGFSCCGSYAACLRYPMRMCRVHLGPGCTLGKQGEILIISRMVLNVFLCKVLHKRTTTKGAQQ